CFGKGLDAAQATVMFRSSKLIPVLAGLLAAAFAAPLAFAAQEFVVGQKGKAFSVKKLAVKVGDTVRFLNEDPFSHNIFSLSDTKSFDLGAFGQGQSRTVTFD